MDEELKHVNPCLPDWLSDEQKEKLRGDSIEGTAYNERWVLRSLSTVLHAMCELLPSLQKERNLVKYDMTPSQSSQTTTHKAAEQSTPLHTPQHFNAASDATPNYVTPEDPVEGDCTPQRQDIVELPDDVEHCVCELWDMCANKFVARHVLQLVDQMVLGMLADALRDTTAPRLTETLCGLVNNICHEDEGCKAVLQKELLMRLLVSLPERCNDSSVLVQAFSLLHRLVFYINRQERAQALLNSNVPSLKHASDDNDFDMADSSNTENLYSTGSSSGPGNYSVTNAVAVPIHPAVGCAHLMEQNGNDPSEVNNTNSAAQNDSNSSEHDSSIYNGQNGTTNGIRNNLQGTDGNSISSGQQPVPGGSSTHPADVGYKDLAKILLEALLSCNLAHSIAYILHHSLHKELVTTTVRLLEELLFFRDPVDNVYMADHYTDSGIVPGLLRQVSGWHRDQNKLQVRQRQDVESRDDFDSGCSVSRLEDDHKKIPPVIHGAFICIYAFVDTKVADFLVSSRSVQARLEPALVHYISELVASVETQLRMLKNQPPPLGPYDDCDTSLSLRLMAEKLGCVLRLLGLLKRSLTLPEVILGLARLLGLFEHSGIFWEDALDKCSSKPTQEIRDDPVMQVDQPEFNRPEIVGDKIENSDRLHSCSLESKIDEEKKQVKLLNPNKCVNFMDNLDMLSVVNHISKVDDRKEQELQMRKAQHQEYERQMRLKSVSRSRRRSSIHFDDVTHIQDSEEATLPEDTLAELRDLRRTIELHFTSTLNYWFTFGDLKDKKGVLCSILVVLEQCHGHEVLIVLDALKKFDASIVAKIQENLLDHQAYPRMVALLAELYQ